MRITPAFAATFLALSGCGPAAPEPAPPSLSAEARKECSELIAVAEREGVILGRSYDDKRRIDVDEGEWAALPATQKTALLAAVSCEVDGVAPADLTFDQGSVAYGFRSGKRLAMFGSFGTKFE